MRAVSDPLRSSVLIVGHPRPRDVAFGADFADGFESAAARCAERAYPVVVLPVDGAEGAERALAFAQELGADSQLVIVQSSGNAEAIRRLVNKGNAFRVLPSFVDPRFDRTIEEALEEHALARQTSKLLHLVSEQNERLTRLSAELEERVERRERHLLDARARLDVANDRLEALHRALIAVHRARSSAEMERLINEALRGALGLSWTRISFGVRRSGTDAMRDAQTRLFAVHSASLLRGREALGEISFARDRDRPFARDEGNFLQQVAEAVSLAIDRLSKLGESETLKHQWEATFDAIIEPVVIIDANRLVARTNRAFAAAAGLAPEAVIGRRCHEALFGRPQPCEGCALGSNFRLAPAKTSGGRDPIYQVFSQATGGQFVNMYRDVATQLRLESQLLESAKMAELGTIGSSIAHEINNPLGGMLSFLQLMKMDLKGAEPWREDVEDMELGARRCRDIVQNLLGFARKSTVDGDGDGAVDLREVTGQALKITELQTRAMGVLVRLELSAGPALARGQFNLLSQAIRFFLQSAQEAIGARAKRESPGAPPDSSEVLPRFRGEISVSVATSETQSRIEIVDNGWRTVATSPIGLTVALEIVRGHGGRAEIEASDPFGAKATIAFPRFIA